LTATDTSASGTVLITAVADAKNATITIIDDLESTNATDVWHEGAWSDYQGFPRTVGIFEQRIILAATAKKPQTIWGSKTGDFEDYESGTNDDDAITYTFASQEQNRIEWVSGQAKLLIGTAGGEWTLGGDAGKPVTPSNVTVLRQSSYGSKHLQAVMVNDAVLYVQRNGLRVRQMIESETSVTAKYVSPDLTIRSEFITSGGVTQSGYTQQPFNIFWCVNGDGERVGMTYERDQNISGWHRIKSDGATGTIESACTIYGTTASGDEDWFVVRRIVDGTEKRFIERINPAVWTEKEDAFYVDSGVTVTLPTISAGALVAGDFYRVIDNTGMDLTAVGGVANPENGSTFEVTISATPTYGTGSIREVAGTFPTAVPHLATETVQVLGDGASYEDITVAADGSITLPDNDKVTKVHIGLQYISRIQPMKLSADARLGAYMGTTLRLREAIVKVRNSLGMRYETNLKEADNETLQQRFVAARDTKDPMDASPPLYTGDIKFFVQSGHDFDGNLTLIQDKPLPFEVTSIIKKVQVTGR